MKFLFFSMICLSLALTLLHACSKPLSCDTCQYDEGMIKNARKTEACVKDEKTILLTTTEVLTPNTSMLETIDVTKFGKTTDEWISDFKKNPKCH